MECHSLRMDHDNFITLPYKLERSAPPFEENDIKSPENLFRHILKKYTKHDDHMFDPFAGLGTSLFVAEELNRIPFGIEAEQQKYQWVAGQLENWTHLVNDDAANLAKYDFPKMDLILTSPPYMLRNHKWNPVFGGDPKYAGYDKYLKRMGVIFGKAAPIMKKNAPLIIQVDNLTHGKIFTPLARDIANAINKNFIQTGETIVQWKIIKGEAKPKEAHTQFLIFKKR